MGNTVVLLTPLSFWMICLRFDSPFTTIDFHSREKDMPIARIVLHMCKKCRYSLNFLLFLKNLYHDITTIFETFWLAHYRNSEISVDGLQVVAEVVHD